MANHTGVEGTVKVGANAIAEIRTWSITHTADVIEDTTQNDSAKTFKSGLTSWTGSLTCFWDETDTTGQGALTAGASVTLNLYPEGASSGDMYFSGSAIVTSVGVSVPTNGMIEQTFAFQGSGALTTTAVAP